MKCEDFSDHKTFQLSYTMAKVFFIAEDKTSFQLVLSEEWKTEGS